MPRTGSAAGLRDGLSRPGGTLPGRAVRSGIPQSWPLLGREAELAHLTGALAGGQHAVVLAGAAGVGKTRLAREAIARAEAQGATTTWVVATRANASIPFGPFAHLLPASLPRMPSRLELLSHISEELASRARGGRLVIGIDDAHFLDEASAALVHQLASSAGFFVLATTRTGDPAPDSITALWKEALAERLEVQALSEGVADELVSRVLGGQVDGPTLARLWEASGGNVLFLRELLLAGQETDALRHTDGVWSWTGPMVVSPRLQEILDARLGSLQPDQVALMEVLAYTEPASVSFLETLFSSSTLEAAERQEVAVVEKDGRRLSVRLAHPLYGESVRARCPVLRARHIQRQIAAALEATGARRRDDLLRMATAHVEGGGSGAPQLLVAGAHRAIASFDLLLAERLGRTALDAGGRIPAAHVLAESLFGQGKDFESALGGIEHVAAGEAERAMTARLRAWGLLWVGEGRPAEAEALLLEAEASIKDGALRDELRAVRAIVLHFSGQLAQAMTIASDILQRPGANEPACVKAALVVVGGLGLAGRGDEAAVIAERWTEAAGRDPSAFSSALDGFLGFLLHVKCWALFFAGYLHEAEALASSEYRRNLAQHAHLGTAASGLFLGLVAMAKGRVQTADRWFREAAGLFRMPTAPNFLPSCLAGLANAAALAGDLPAAEAALAEAESVLTPGMALFGPQLALSRVWLAAASGEVSKARALALDIAHMLEESGAYGIALWVLHDVARLGDAPAVATRLRRLASFVEGPFAPACAAHAEALTAHNGSALDQASALFEAIGADLLAAEAAAEAAAVYRSEGRKTSMRASSARARRLLDAREGALTPALSGLAPDPLSPREREVAMLAAGGLTSPEIAERLVLSVRTVENHLQRGYDKLGVANRSELQRVL